ncbi:hypothetical protein P201_gp42 [Pelagibacter phage HTVC201P]|nr:hypothetical protein P201_gp42 [Pelagibacter phage HTVC201P]
MAYTTIKKSSEHFTPFTFTGSGSAGTRTGVGFTPDMFIHKNRDNNQGWGVIDVIRGNGNYLATNNANAEGSDVGAYGITTDGYTFPNGDAFFNGSGNNMAYWNWKAGGTGVSNTDGSITSTVSANTTSGFSIVSWTGTGATATIGHGLGVAPKMIIVKRLGSATNWTVYTTVIDGSNDYLNLNTTDPKADSGNALPTSTVFSKNDTNAENVIAYCFAEKQGFSKFGSYTGNGNADGTFVYTGFKPALVILKRTESTGTDWNLVDNKRAGYNPDNYFLAPNSSGAENSVNDIVDLLSNGFKLTSASGASNASGGSYIYMAFAEEPLVGDNPCTAR